MNWKLWVIVVIMGIGFVANALDLITGAPQKIQTPEQQRFISLTAMLFQMFVLYAILGCH